SPDSRFVAVGSAAGTDGYAWVVDARTGRSVSGLLHEGPVFAVAFSPDSKYLATASADHTARVILTETGKEISRLQHQDGVNAVVFSRNGEFVATASEDNTARVIQTLTGKEISRMPHENEVHTVAFSPDGLFLATGTHALPEAKDQIKNVNTLTLFTNVTGKAVFHDPGAAKTLAVRL